ncbi:Uncharacterised protein [Streptococcus pneumoniae]|nr:Uncharacterised protein [Streptococcus pneumoniae]
MHESGMGNMVPGDKNFAKGFRLQQNGNMHLVFIYIQIIFIIMVYYLVGTLSIILIKKKEFLLCYFQM